MVELALSVDVAAPVEQTWAAAVAWPRQGEWMLATRVRAVGSGGTGVGARLEALTGIGPLAVRDPMTVTVWQPPHLCEVLHTGRVVRGTGRFEVRERPGGGSTFHWSEQLQLPLGVVGRAGWLLVRPLFRYGVALSLRRFARWVESGAVSSPGRPASP